MLLSLLLFAGAPYDYSFTIWDLDTAYRDFGFFQRQVDACVEHGFTILELGAGWPDCEPEPGVFDFSMVEKRAAYAREKGLRLRLRLNMRDWPAWFEPDLYTMPNGEKFAHHGGFPSVFSARNREHQLRFAAALARHFAGHGHMYTPGFSVHMEVKFGDWNSYEPAAREVFRRWLAGRYGDIDALNDAWGTDWAAFSLIDPPVPGPTNGAPSLDEAEIDWIRFREAALAEWVAAFAGTIRSADPSARISVPLGESFRAGSARMSNHGYWVFTRHADEVVHSYDFFRHGPDGLRHVAAATATMTGITRKPVVFEIDGPYQLEHHGYTQENYVEAARLALDAGVAGVQVTNWGSVDISEKPFLNEIGRLVRENEPIDRGEPAVIYYLSKWQHYCYREKTEWVYDRQFALWFKLRDAGVRTRIVTDENLLNEMFDAELMLLPFASVLDAPVRERIRALSYGMRMIADTKPGASVISTPVPRMTGAQIEVTATPFTEDERSVEDILSPPEGMKTERLRVAAVQFHTSFDIEQNTRKIVDYLERAANKGVRVVVFTEMALTGYSKAADFAERLDWSAVDNGLEQIRAECRELELFAVVGMPTRDKTGCYCSAVAIDPSGEVIDVYEKIYRAGERWAEAGRRLSTFEVDGVKCGSFICHDSRYGPLVQLRALAGTRLFFYLSCESGVGAEHKMGPYRAQIQARAVENGVYVIQANTPATRTDPDAKDRSHGQSMVVAPDGNVIESGPIYEDAMVVTDIDVRHARRGGLRSALSDGPLADWMRRGVKRVLEPCD